MTHHLASHPLRQRKTLTPPPRAGEGKPSPWSLRSPYDPRPGTPGQCSSSSLKRGASSPNGECPQPSNHDSRACGMAARLKSAASRQHDGILAPVGDQDRHAHLRQRRRSSARHRSTSRRSPGARQRAPHVVGERAAELRFARLLAVAAVEEGDRGLDLLGRATGFPAAAWARPARGSADPRSPARRRS